MENNQTIAALLEEIKVLKETVITINASLTTLVKITEDREKRFAERGARTQGDRNSSDRGGFRPRSDRGDSSWGNNSGFSRRDRDDRNRNKG